MKKFLYLLCFVLPTVLHAMEVDEVPQSNVVQGNEQQLFINNEFSA